MTVPGGQGWFIPDTKDSSKKGRNRRKATVHVLKRTTGQTKLDLESWLPPSSVTKQGTPDTHEFPPEAPIPPYST